MSLCNVTTYDLGSGNAVLSPEDDGLWLDNTYGCNQNHGLIISLRNS